MDRAPVSLRVTLLPETTVTAPLKLLALFRVMSLAAPAVSEVVVPMVRLPVSVIAPPAVTRQRAGDGDGPQNEGVGVHQGEVEPVGHAHRPGEVVGGRVQVTLFPAPGLKEVVPPISSAPLSVMAPVVLTDSAPPTVEGPRSTAPPAVRVKLVADRRGGDGQGPGVVEGDVVARDHGDRPAEVVGVVQGDVVGRPGSERGGGADGQVAGIGDRPAGGHRQRAGDGDGPQHDRVGVHQGEVGRRGDTHRRRRSRWLRCSA